MTFQERWDYQRMMYESCYPHHCPRCSTVPKYEPRYICHKCGFNLLTGHTESLWTRRVKPISLKVLKLLGKCLIAYLLLLLGAYLINHPSLLFLGTGALIGVLVTIAVMNDRSHK